MKIFNTFKQSLRRPTHGLLALALLLGVAAPVLTNTVAHADQVTSRSIKMSSSQPGATNVTYTVSFTPKANAQELIIDFCGDTPLIGADCAFDSTNVPGLTGTLGATENGTAVTIATVGSGSPVHTLKITGLTTMTAGNTDFSIDITGITNPTKTGSFFARLVTYTTGNSGNYAPADTTGTATTVGTHVDDGGIALSTAELINITARVMESLSICVYKEDTTGTTCGTGLPPNIELGSGDPAVVSSTPSQGELLFNLSTNASEGAQVNLRGDTLYSGANNIDPLTTAAALASMVNGEHFGVHVGGTGDIGTYTGDLAAPTATIGSVTADPAYAPGANYDQYFFDPAASNIEFGDPFCTTDGAPVQDAVVPFTYVASASLTTPAGVYTAQHQLIATGKF